MVVWSSICRAVGKVNPISIVSKPSGTLPAILKNASQVRQMSSHGPRLMHITPSRFQWHKFKDQFHFYVLLGVIPLCTLVFGVNVFIGPATLSPIPEGYEPKQWEYYKHPITRFFGKYLFPSFQQDYEIMLHSIYEEHEKMELRALEKKIKAKIAERKDYQAYYYRPVTAKYIRVSKEAAEFLESMWGN